MKIEKITLKAFQAGSLGLIFWQPLAAAICLLGLVGLEFGLRFLEERSEHRRKVEDPALVKVQEDLKALTGQYTKLSRNWPRSMG